MSGRCAEFHQLVRQGMLYAFPFQAAGLPANGIYLLFEQGESAHGGARIVRVGTHTGDDHLVSRLNEHFIKENKDRSIFRKNIGRALLSRRGDPFLAKWEVDLTTRAARTTFAGGIDPSNQKAVEVEVTRYIRSAFSFVVLRVDDKSSRLGLESRIISTLSLCEECRPSETWLGLSSPKSRIRDSGLWIVHELYHEPLAQTDLERLASALI